MPGTAAPAPALQGALVLLAYASVFVSVYACYRVLSVDTAEGGLGLAFCTLFIVVMGGVISLVVFGAAADEDGFLSGVGAGLFSVGIVTGVFWFCYAISAATWSFYPINGGEFRVLQDGGIRLAGEAPVHRGYWNVQSVPVQTVQTLEFKKTAEKRDSTFKVAVLLQLDAVFAQRIHALRAADTGLEDLEESLLPDELKKALDKVMADLYQSDPASLYVGARLESKIPSLPSWIKAATVVEARETYPSP